MGQRGEPRMKIRMVLAMALLMMVAGCASSVRSISPKRAKEMMENNAEVVLVDVRTYEEYVAERIPNAIWVPLTDLETQAPLKMADLKATYIIYCRSGNRSVEAILLLKEMGYKSLYDLGGIIDWPYEKIG